MHLTVLNVTRTSVLQYYKQVLSCELTVPFMGQSDYGKQYGHHISQHIGMQTALWSMRLSSDL